VFYISARSSKEIVDAEDGRPVREQALAEMRSEETSAASNQYTRFKMHVPLYGLPIPWPRLRCSANSGHLFSHAW
jgi:hypothetical protein